MKLRRLKKIKLKLSLLNSYSIAKQELRPKKTTLDHIRVIEPIQHKWDDWFDQNNATDDFMNERAQDADQVRNSL